LRTPITPLAPATKIRNALSLGGSGSGRPQSGSCLEPKTLVDRTVESLIDELDRVLEELVARRQSADRPHGL
jgi:hypothetical protein